MLAGKGLYLFMIPVWRAVETRSRNARAHWVRREGASSDGFARGVFYPHGFTRSVSPKICICCTQIYILYIPFFLLLSSPGVLRPRLVFTYTSIPLYTCTEFINLG